VLVVPWSTAAAYLAIRVSPFCYFSVTLICAC
jgi:hypothetical protein